MCFLAQSYSNNAEVITKTVIVVRAAEIDSGADADRRALFTGGGETAIQTALGQGSLISPMQGGLFCSRYAGILHFAVYVFQKEHRFIASIARHSERRTVAYRPPCPFILGSTKRQDC